MTTETNAFRLPRMLAGDPVVARLAGVAGAGWLTWLAMIGAGGPRGWTTLLTALPLTVGFTLPAVLVAVPLTLRALRQTTQRRRSTLITALVCAPVAAAAMSAGNQLRLVLLDQAPTGLPIITMVGDALTLLVVLLPVAWLLLALRVPPSRQRRSRVRSRDRVGLALGLGVATALSTAAMTPAVALVAAGSTSPTTTCLGSVPRPRRSTSPPLTSTSRSTAMATTTPRARCSL